MAKSKDELEKLKQEYREFNAKLHELSDDELKIVSGGSGGEASRYIGHYEFLDHVVAENAVVDHAYYITLDGKDSWYRGSMYEIKEESYFLFFTRRHYFVRLTDKDGYGCSGTLDFYSTDVTLYETMIRHWES